MSTTQQLLAANSDRRLKLVLHPGARILRRDNAHVQCGIDGATAGIINVGEQYATQVIAALRLLHRPVDLDRLLDKMLASGLGLGMVISIVEDLLLHGVLRPVIQPIVVVIGETPLAYRLISDLQSSNIQVRKRFANEPLGIGLKEAVEKQWPVILVDHLDCGLAECRDLLKFHPTSLSVMAIDTRGLIGPVRRDGQGPCPVCVQLHWANKDPRFCSILRQSVSQPIRQDPAVIAATSGAAVGIIHRLVGLRSTASAGLELPSPGECFLVDPYAPQFSQGFELFSHPHCPACFETEVT